MAGAMAELHLTLGILETHNEGKVFANQRGIHKHAAVPGLHSQFVLSAFSLLWMLQLASGLVTGLTTE